MGDRHPTQVPGNCPRCGSSPEAAGELAALRERVEALEVAAHAVCDGQATRASVNNLRAILSHPQPTSLQKMQRTPGQQGGEDA